MTSLHRTPQAGYAISAVVITASAMIFALGMASALDNGGNAPPPQPPSASASEYIPPTTSPPIALAQQAEPTRICHHPQYSATIHYPHPHYEWQDEADMITHGNDIYCLYTTTDESDIEAQVCYRNGGYAQAYDPSHTLGTRLCYSAGLPTPTTMAPTEGGDDDDEPETPDSTCAEVASFDDPTPDGYGCAKITTPPCPVKRLEFTINQTIDIYKCHESGQDGAHIGWSSSCQDFQGHSGSTDVTIFRFDGDTTANADALLKKFASAAPYQCEIAPNE